MTDKEILTKEILTRIKGHPFLSLRGTYREIVEPEEFWELIEDKCLVENILYRPSELAGDKHGPKRRLIKEKIFENVSFSYTVISDLTFEGCVFVNCIFVGTTFRDLRISKCTFHNCNVGKCQFSGTYVHVVSFDACLNKDKHANIGLHLYQQLKRNFKDQDQPDFLREADYLFMKWKRYQLIYEVSQNKERSYFSLSKNFGIFTNYIYEIVFGYGILIRKLVRATLCLFAFFGVINYIFWDDVTLLAQSPDFFGKVFAVSYYTAISLSNLGYGDAHPHTNAGFVIASLQAILGAIWFAVMASMIFKKIAR